MTEVLHLTAHLGGGVGKALAALVAPENEPDSEFHHSIVCLEKPEKTQAIEHIEKSGTSIIFHPTRDGLAELVRRCDILQLEWWNHPATLKALCELPASAMRLLVWSHISGLHNPIIPSALIEAAQTMVLTSPCSLEAKEVSCLAPRLDKRLAVVPSSGGYEGLPMPVARSADTPLAAGYIGSLNFAKLHPDYVNFLAAVKLPKFSVSVFGDCANQSTLRAQCERANMPDLLDFHGYTADISSALSSVNVMAYLLNPLHYGTTENGLLEAMATGVVPIVLDNPVERHIVEHGKTGLIVRSPTEFGRAVEWLARHPARRFELGACAARSVRKAFTPRHTAMALGRHYRRTLSAEKKKIDFNNIFGPLPSDWFLSCQRKRSQFLKSGQTAFSRTNPPSHDLFESTKGTVFHFHGFFPQDRKLESWASSLRKFTPDSIGTATDEAGLFHTRLDQPCAF